MSGLLAIQGGSPVRKTPLAFFRPTLGPEEEREVIDTLRSGWLTRGPKTDRFEKMFSEFTGAPHAIALNSCTAALHLSLRAAGVGPGDEVITTPLTFAATAHVIVHSGARPVFADVEPESLTLDPADVEERFTDKTKALLPVHLYGQPCDMDSLLSLARDRDAAVIEDAAHAIGAVYHGKKVGTLGDFTCFSFHPIKNITTGEGGMLTTSDAEQASRIRIWSQQGLDRNAWERHGPGGHRHWSVVEIGFKYSMSDLQASLGLHQLPRLEKLRKRRQEITERYDEAFEGVPEISPIHHPTRGSTRSALHLYTVLLRPKQVKARRDEIVEAIQKENIGLRVQYPALHLEPAYRKMFGNRKGSLPVAEAASENLFCLPIYPAMSDRDVDDTIAAVKKVLRAFRR